MIRIVAVGKIKEKALSQLIAEYVKRLSAFTRVEIIEVADEHAPQSNSDAENELVKEREGAPGHPHSPAPSQRSVRSCLGPHHSFHIR